MDQGYLCGTVAGVCNAFSPASLARCGADTAVFRTMAQGTRSGLGHLGVGWGKAVPLGKLSLVVGVVRTVADALVLGGGSDGHA